MLVQKKERQQDGKDTVRKAKSKRNESIQLIREKKYLKVWCWEGTWTETRARAKQKVKNYIPSHQYHIKFLIYVFPFYNSHSTLHIHSWEGKRNTVKYFYNEKLTDYSGSFPSFRSKKIKIISLFISGNIA